MAVDSAGEVRVDSTFRNAAVLGGLKGDEKTLISQINNGAEALLRDGAISEHYSTIQNGAAEKAVVILGVPGAKSVEDLDRIAGDVTGANGGIREKAAQQKEILARQVYVAMGKSGFDGQLDSGDATSVEAVLPEPLKGLGETIVGLHYRSNPEIVGALTELDRYIKFLGNGRENSVHTRIEATIQHLAELGANETNPAQDAKYITVLAYLNEKARLVKEKMEGRGDGNTDAAKAIKEAEKRVQDAERESKTAKDEAKRLREQAEEDRKANKDRETKREQWDAVLAELRKTREAQERATKVAEEAARSGGGRRAEAPVAPATTVDEEAAYRNARAEREATMKISYFKAMFVSPTPDSTQPGSTLAPEWQIKMNNDDVEHLVGLNNAAYVVTNTKSLGELVESGAGMYRALNKHMDVYLNTEGVRPLFADILQKYFKPVEFWADNEKGERTHYFNLEVKTGPDGKPTAEVKAAFRDLEKMFNDYLGPLSDMVSGNTRLERESNAAMALGIVGAFIRVSHLGNDVIPKGGWDMGNMRNQVWNAFYPNEKGRQKIGREQVEKEGQEPWGGDFGIWLVDRIKSGLGMDKGSHTKGLDAEFIRQWEAGEVRPLPEKCLVNYFSETRIKIVGGREMCMLEALYHGYQIDFKGNQDKTMGFDSWAGFYHDKVRAAAAMFNFMSGGKGAELDLNKNGEVWGNGIYGNWVYLRSDPYLKQYWSNERTIPNNNKRGKLYNFFHRNEKHSPLAERIMWFIGACSGGFADSPELMIARGALDNPYQHPQSWGVSALLNSSAIKQMLVEKEDREWIARSLHAFGNTMKNNERKDRIESYHQRREINSRIIGKRYSGRFMGISN